MNKIVYFNGSFSNEDEVCVSPFDRGYMFSDGVYEAIRTYNKKLFKYDEHINRLSKNLSELKIKYDSLNDLKSKIEKLIALNQLNNVDVKIYLQVTRGISSPRTHYYDPEQMVPNTFITASSIADNSHDIQNGIKIILENDYRWSRCDIKTIALLPAVMAKQKALEQNAADAIWVRNGELLEGTHTSFFAVKGESIYTAPLSNLILPSVTRQVILELCRENNIAVIEEAVKQTDINNFQEFFIVGTTTEIKPVVQIDDWKLNDSKPGKITRKIQEIFFTYVKNY